MKQVWRNCHAATMQGGAYSIIERAAIVTEDGRIAWIGPEAEMPLDGSAAVQDLGGAWVTPGLVDCHTHLVFGGNRSLEFEQRLQGVDYAEIAARAAASPARCAPRAPPPRTSCTWMRAARAAPAARRRDHAGGQVGYGLDLPNERKMLRVARRLGRSLPLTVRATCLAAHALPPEFTGRPDDYIDEVARRMLPVLAAEGLVDAVDAFCEHLAFSPAQVERCSRARRTWACRSSCMPSSYLTARRHAGGAPWRAVGRSPRIPDRERCWPWRRPAPWRCCCRARLRAARTRLPPVDLLRRHGVPIAISTDQSGTSPALSLRLMLSMACTLFRLTPEEAWPAPPSMGPARWDWRPRMARWKRARRRTSWPGASIIRRSWPTGLAANCPGASSGMGSRCTRRAGRGGLTAARPAMRGLRRHRQRRQARLGRQAEGADRALQPLRLRFQRRRRRRPLRPARRSAGSRDPSA